MKTKLSKTILFVLVLSVALSACGAGAPAATPTASATYTPLPPTFTPTVTLTPTKTPTPTATPNLTATHQYENFVALVQRIYAAGQISTTDGNYIELDDYQDEVANKLSYSWTETGINAKNFIIRADFEWSSAIKTANISGCGYVYRVQSNKDHYLIVLDAFQGVKLASSTDRGTYSMGPPTKGEKISADFGSGPYHATFTLVVNDLKAYVYVNDIYSGEYTLLEYRITDSGSLAAAVLSATDEGYGTRCKITNAEVWVIEE